VHSGPYSDIVAFSLEVQDCSVQVISLAGEALANSGVLSANIPKNQGLISLITAAVAASWFTVSDTRPECAITEYVILNTLPDSNFDAVYDVANYALNGNVNLLTDLNPVNLEQYSTGFTLQARHSNNDFGGAADVVIQLEIGCYAISSITVEFAANA